MSEGSPVPPPESEAPKQNSPEKGFDRSWLIDTEEDFNYLRSGKAGTAGKKIAMMHQTGLVNTLNADQIADRVAKWGEEAVEEGDEVLVATAPYFISMTDRVQQINKLQEARLPAEGLQDVSVEEAKKRIADEIGLRYKPGGATIPPQEIVASFRQGRLGIFETDWERRVVFLNIDKKEDRENWVLLNMGAFVNGVIPAPETQWKGILDRWLGDLGDAYTLHRRDMESEGKPVGVTEAEIEETRNYMIDLMAIAAPARAMEQSDGSPERYVALVTQSEKGDLDKQDLWAKFLLAKDPEKYWRMINNPMVAHYYKQIIKDAGIPDAYEDEGQVKTFYETGQKSELNNINDKVRLYKKKIEQLEDQLVNTVRSTPTDSGLLREIRQTREKLTKLEQEKLKLGSLSAKEGDISNFYPDREKAIKGELFKYLVSTKKYGYKGGFNAYVKEVLLKRDTEEQIKEWSKKGISIDERRAAAKLAADAFLVDKYTRWEFAITKGYDPDSKPVVFDINEPGGDGLSYQLLPFEGWGGDPFRSLLEPSFLPRRIKEVYKKEDKAILAMGDAAFLPKDVFSERYKLKDKELKASAATHLKNYARWNQALALIYGSSRAAGIPMWGKQTFEETLPQVVELLDQVYGGETTDEQNPSDPNGDKIKFPIGKHILGVMLARTIEMKALAAASESRRPGFFDLLRYSMDPQKGGHPFQQIAQELWGPFYNGKDGFLVKIAGSRARVVLSKKNRFDAYKHLSTAYNILITNDQNAQGFWKTQAVSIISRVEAFAEAFARFNP